MRREKDGISLDARTAINVYTDWEEKAQPYRCVDFVVENDDSSIWLIEFTGRPSSNRATAAHVRTGLLTQLSSPHMKREALMKFYGTHAYIGETYYRRDFNEVYCCLILGVPDIALPAASRSVLRDQVHRIIERVGPSLFGRIKPIVKVETVDSWNASHPNMQVT